jgi:hypothetical protein
VTLVDVALFATMLPRYARLVPFASFTATSPDELLNTAGEAEEA